jgi:hypothetical protein
MKSTGQSIFLLIAVCIATPCLGVEELPHITTGPILGRLSAHGIGVWARTSRATTFQVRYGLSQDAMDQITDPVPTTLEHDLSGMEKSDADFIFVVSSVNFMVPHVGGGAVRANNKDDAWTVFA